MTKLHSLGFRCETDFDAALQRTIDWYRQNEPWWRGIKERSAEYQAFYAKQYGTR
jgi:dTDP-glucose 4,6-dehydratase